MATVQQIAKILNSNGLKKASTQRVNFETIRVGNYEARHLKIYGLNNIIVTPKNGTTPEQIQNALPGIATQIKNSVVVIL